VDVLSFRPNSESLHEGIVNKPKNVLLVCVCPQGMHVLKTVRQFFALTEALNNQTRQESTRSPTILDTLNLLSLEFESFKFAHGAPR
jgi:hypothetical protein